MILFCPTSIKLSFFFGIIITRNINECVTCYLTPGHRLNHTGYDFSTYLPNHSTTSNLQCFHVLTNSNFTFAYTFSSPNMASQNPRHPMFSFDFWKISVDFMALLYLLSFGISKSFHHFGNTVNYCVKFTTIKPQPHWIS